ncbi:hypothetical protein AQUCO_03500263v1 [Aquilegia coerulea]|uniref:DUF295 domain-containing protein n=1 Tax=Aquilegia coerulea TaxID=218851 RepID=A0A2G5CWX4_AQUCA|nr:hypothetical protein AQUCO_03500263v1 [Aquilegia coerulea]
MKSTKEEAEVSITRKSQRTLPPTYSPSVVFIHGKRFRDQTFCTLSDGCFHRRSIPELRGMYILTLSHGWLMLQSYYSKECSLFNPVSLTKLILPPLMHTTFDLGVLTTSPSDPNCIVMLVSDTRKSFCFYRIGDDKWIEQKLLPPKMKEPVLINWQISVISCKGKVYVFFFQGMIVIDVQNTSASIKLRKIDCKLSLIWATRWTSNVVESCGEIFQVVGVKLGYLSYSVRAFDVFKLDLSTLDWVKVETLGDRVFLLGPSGTTSMSLSATESGLKADCVYFSHPGYTTLCRFDMHDETIMTLPCPTKFPYWEGPFWVVPNPKPLLQKQMVKMEQSNHQGNEDWGWNDLPTELLELIFSFTFLGDCIHFRLTCKSCLSITPPLQSNRLLNKFLSEPRQLPWLMSLPKSNVCNLYHPIYSDAYTMNVPELAGATIRSAKYGWLLMSRGNACFFFFNPSTMEIIKLPNSRPLHIAGISFSSAPTSSDFVVIAYVATIMLVYRRDKETWSFHFILDKKWEFSQSLCNPVFHDGVFYCLSKNGRLGLFDPMEINEESRWRVFPESAVFAHSLDSSYMLSIRSFIVEDDGEILSVFVGLQGKPIRVYKLDLSKMKWTEVDSLGNKVLFLSHTASILVSVPAGSKGIQNRIYFPRFHGHDTVFYSLTTGNYHCFGSKYSREDWVDSWEHSHSTWIQPTK